MPGRRRVEIKSEKRLLDDFFKIDEYSVSHEQYDGKMSADQRRLNFERGDAVAVLLLNVDTRIGDLFNNPYDQVREQLRVTIESVKERQENELLNNAEYGLLNNVPDSQRISTRKGAPTPDDLDELLTKVWKEPSFFVAHPRAIAAFGRECTRRGVPPPTVTLFGNPFLTWRGIPLIPTDKVRIAGKVPKSRILLIRVGERKQGVIGLFQPGLTGEQSPGLSVRFTGINERGLASYLISLYCSASVLTDDAIASLDDVEVGQYHEYAK